MKAARRTRPFDLILLGLALAGPFPVAASSQPVEEITVSGPRLRPAAGDRALSISRLEGEALRTAPQMRLDAILGRIPGLGLFRRASSLSAHPTTQGVTLRSMGPNGAGRTLVLLDGVPVNDPFGGWVYWSAMSPETIEAVEVVRGGGAGRWGGGALAGTIALHSRFRAEETFEGQIRGGAFETLEGRGALFLESGGRRGFLAGHHFESDGFFLHPKGQRGPVDVPAASRASAARGGLELALGGTRLLGKLSYFGEARTNGLELARNATEGWQASLHLVRETGPGAPAWQLNAYYRRRDFESSFAAVDETRSSAREVLDQFDVPAEGYGLNGIVRLPAGRHLAFEAGLDLRRMEGETNERFRNLGAGFTRQRQAGGEQWLAGGYAELTREGPAGLMLAGSVRLDYWKISDGRRRESDLADRSILRQDLIPDRDGLIANGRLALRYEAGPAAALRLAAYSGFRLPTINEFYRPFRVGNDITEANPTLDPERLYGLEAGLDYAGEAAEISVTLFRNWLEDGVGNVTLALGPGNFPPVGFVPAGGSLRQRQNIDRIAATGLEAEARWRPAAQTEVSLGYLFTNPEVRRFAARPELEGKRLAQAPRHQLSLVLDQALGRGLRIAALVRWVGKTFDDDQNDRVLDDFVSLDLCLSAAVSDHATLFVAAENLFDRTIPSALSADGLVTRAERRLISGGLRVGF